MNQRTALQEPPARDREHGTDAAASKTAAPVPNSALVQMLSGIGAPWATALLTNLSASNSAVANALDPSELVDLVTDMEAESTAAAPGTAAPPDKVPGSTAPAAPGEAARPASQTEAQPQPAVVDEQPTALTAPEVAATDGVHAPAQDPAFQAVVARATTAAAQQRAHMPARGAATSAQNAAPGPANDVQSQAAARTAERLEQTPTPGFDRAAFKARLLEQIAAAAPKTSKEAKDFPKENRMGKAKQAMLGDAAQAGDAAQGGMRQQVQQPPDVAGIVPKPTSPLDVPQPITPPTSIQAADAAPKPRADDEVTAPFVRTNQGLDQQMSDAGVTDEQLAASNEPTFVGAVQSRHEAKARGEQAPQTFRQGEAGTVSQAQVEAENIAGGALGGMYETQAGLLGQVAGAQQQTMTADQERRAQVAAQIESIYQSTGQRLTARMQQMDEEITRVFDSGAEAARASFESYVDDRLDDRYSGLRGKWRWLKDKVLSWGLAAPVARIFADAREHYLTQMEAVIDQVVGVVERGITDARAIVAEGRQQIATYVESLPAELQDVGQQAAADIGSRFDELEASIDAKQNELVDSLTRRYVEQATAIDARIEELQSEHASFASRAYNAVKGVVEAILRLKDMLLGVLARAADAIGGIISDPIGFLGNLIGGVKAGLDNFLSRIWGHLSRAMQEWLFGALSGAGIDLPENFDEAGILDLVLQVIGLTYQGIRARAVRLVGEDVVARLEQFAEPFIVLIREGPGGLWEWIKEQLTNLKDMVLGEIQDWAITRVIKAGIVWIISLLNPAAAFIKACKLIYDIVMFFIERGSQIIEMVNAVVDSIAAIAKGAIGGVATKIENALARTLPVVISFLASLLGLGGISDKIRAVIEKLQAPVSAAVDWVIEKSVSLVRAAGNLLGLGPAEAEQTSTTDAEAEGPVDGVKALARSELAPLLPKVTTPAELQATLSAIMGRHRGEGLQRLHAVHDDERPGVFEIHAVASPGELVGAAELVQEIVLPQFDFRWPRTVAHARFNGAEYGPMGNEQLVKRSDPAEEHSLHAETLVVAWLEGRWLVRDKQDDPGPYELEVSISRSPCETCAINLDHFVRTRQLEGFKIDSTIRFASLYHGADPVREKAQLHWLAIRGHKLEVWDILAELEYFYGPGVSQTQVTDDQRAELARRIEQVRQWLHQTESLTDVT